MVSGYWNVPAHAGIRKVDSHGFLKACIEAYERQLQGCPWKVRSTSEHGTVPQRRSAIGDVVRTRLQTTTDRRVALIFRGQCGGSGPPHSRFGGTKRPPESTDHFKINAQHELHQWQRRKLKSGNYFDTINPANERVLSRVTEVDVSPARNASTPLR